MPSSEPFYRELEPHDFDGVLRFADTHIGVAYFSPSKLQKIFEASRKGTVTTSLVLVARNQIAGIRLTYPPGQWIEREPGQEIHPHLWKTSLQETGYFQSLFLAPEFQRQGWGKKLSLAALEKLKSVGAKAAVCHSWNESPGDSSRRYLLSIGFNPVTEVPNFWKSVDYTCPICGKPCLCTATEMIRYI